MNGWYIEILTKITGKTYISKHLIKFNPKKITLHPVKQKPLLQAAFYILSILAIFSALMVVFSRNPIHSVLYLIIAFFAITGHYALLNAQFLAIVNFIVYAGAIMVLFLFVVMLLNLNAETEPHKSTLVKFAAVIAGGLLLVVLAASVHGTAPDRPY